MPEHLQPSAPGACPFDHRVAAFDPYTDYYMANPAELVR